MKILALLSLLCSSIALGQQLHSVQLPTAVNYQENLNIHLGSNTNPQGNTLALNNFYLTQNNQAIFPVMGEFQFSRYPKEQWETALLKMKASGIQVIGFYTFWIHHEAVQGTFNFEGNNNLKRFLQLIKKHQLQAVVRIGPWVHGETRNGGFPDWFVKKYQKGGFDRVFTDGKIQPEVETFYKAIAKQLQGFYFKEGGPIIGVQLDNEVRSNGPESWGYHYYLVLKKAALKAGIDVPYYFVTGWPGTGIPDTETIPLWGGYPAAPWTGNSKPLAPNKLYTFVTDRRDQTIGNDILQYDAMNSTPLYKHPFLTVELGGGIQNTYHRRPIIAPKDLMGIAYTRLGVGANMLGYYIYHGVQHPLSPFGYGTQESKGSVFPYPNDYPIISYDFQAPISESGFTQPSYNYFKQLHLFVQSYGAYLAPMLAVIPADSPTEPTNTTDLRYAIRYQKESGFIFYNNYARHQELVAHPETVFEIKTSATTQRIPLEGSIDIPKNTMGSIPFQYPISENIMLTYALAQPVTLLPKEKLWIYSPLEGVPAEFVLNSDNIADIKTNGTVTKLEKHYVVKELTPGKNCTVEITSKDGNTYTLLVLNEAEALNSYVFETAKGQQFIICDQSLWYDAVADEFHTQTTETTTDIYAFPELKKRGKALKKQTSEGFLSHYQIQLSKVAVPQISFKEITDTPAYTSYLSNLRNTTPSRPAYATQLTEDLHGKRYVLEFPQQLPKGISDLKIVLQYQGNTAALYANDVIIEDDYYNGTAKTMSYQRIQQHEAENYTLEITPLLPEHLPYLEPEVSTTFTQTQPALLLNITTIPVYEFTF
ncbi:Glycosyl hydrolases family 35 [Pustulibacterium marinum]|uniref:Glycosyl hydrolases family 35 n=1 Tax=Pustulibacterium marinum TaxID=1224947 RepID=A0A1I7HXD8_9FLAO|nr:beta-galactosidase [Pustulibacterium marinum]SFU65384.1 Glycosyl hydrolases family 35 [Pustulibacterium marinum]